MVVVEIYLIHLTIIMRLLYFKFNRDYNYIKKLKLPKF